MIAIFEEAQLLELLEQHRANIFEQASAMQMLCSRYGYTQACLAKKLHISQSCVGNKIRLLQFSDAEQAQLLEFGLSERHARALLRVKPPKRERLIATAGNMHLTVQQTEDLIDKYQTNSSEQQTACTNFAIPADAESFLLQTQNGAERLRSLGYKTTCLTESGEGWRRITVTIVN